MLNCSPLSNPCLLNHDSSPTPLQVQRSDDTEDKVRNRLRTYHNNVDAVVGYYKDCLVEVGAVAKHLYSFCPGISKEDVVVVMVQRRGGLGGGLQLGMGCARLHSGCRARHAAVVLFSIVQFGVVDSGESYTGSSIRLI